ncbi:transposable element Tc1 transposase [Trichonephila clavipes]|nr:transposable element Tc1 transposase [Trichonephila clavipes]
MSRRRIRAHYEQLSEFERGSDESRFHLRPDDHRRRIWRQTEQRADPAFTISHHTGPQQGVMDWRTISFEAGTLCTLACWWIFEQDNGKPHTTRVAINCLTAYQTLPWPARSLSNRDVRYMMGRRLHLPGNVDDLVQQWEQIW